MVIDFDIDWFIKNINHSDNYLLEAYDLYPRKLSGLIEKHDVKEDLLKIIIYLEDKLDSSLKKEPGVIKFATTKLFDLIKDCKDKDAFFKKIPGVAASMNLKIPAALNAVLEQYNLSKVVDDNGKDASWLSF